MLLNEALTIAERIQEQLAPHCAPNRCLIAGSIRRRKPECYKSGDLWHAAMWEEKMASPPVWQSEQEFYDWLGVPYLEPEQRTWPL